MTSRRHILLLYVKISNQTNSNCENYTREIAVYMKSKGQLTLALVSLLVESPDEPPNNNQLGTERPRVLSQICSIFAI